MSDVADVSTDVDTQGDYFHLIFIQQCNLCTEAVTVFHLS